jgi:hypothetical protein
MHVISEGEGHEHVTVCLPHDTIFSWPQFH